MHTYHDDVTKSLYLKVTDPRKIAFTLPSWQSSLVTMTTPEYKEKQVIIIGCGIFGLSTALWIWMLKKGSYRVTLLEKEPPSSGSRCC